MRIPLIVGNWKLHTTPTTAKDLAQKIRLGLSGLAGREVVICPPVTSLAAVAEAIRDSNVQLGAQNMHWEQKGAFTGEVSGEALLELGCRYVIIGHSERRQYFFETDPVINKKLKRALTLGLKPIVCVGEKLEEREAGQMFAVVEKQFSGAFADILPADISKGDIALAYEPVWAIGTGRNATPEQAEEVHYCLRGLLTKRFSNANVRILYGGSVKPDDIDSLMAKPDIDGVLVGGASLDGDSFIRIARFE